jgi:hypothetical protein
LSPLNQLDFAVMYYKVMTLAFTFPVVVFPENSALIAIFNRCRRVSLRHGCFTSLALGMLFVLTLTIAQPNKPIAEEIEWMWEVRPQRVDIRLPNVLLLGDSITRNYFPQVTQDLAGIANVYLMASSTSVGDPRLPQQIAEFAALHRVSFAIVHFNNGMHG